MVADPDRLRQEDARIHTKEREDTFGSMLDNAWILNLLLVAFGVFALITEWRRTGFALDLNSIIVMLVLGGLLLHLRPSAYIGQSSTRLVSAVLSFCNIRYTAVSWGIITTGLAGVLSRVFIRLTVVWVRAFIESNDVRGA
jgi:short-chain fatty acids transporter